MSKQNIRNKTGTFLQNTQGIDSFRFFPEDKFYTGSTASGDVSALTGAIAPILPMRIMTAGKGESTIDFTLLMNPESWNHAKTNSYQSAYTREGWVQQLWGPNQDTISSSGKSAAMMNPVVGLESFLQQTTFAYLNLMALIGAYRTNGCEFYDRRNSQTVTRVINRITGVHIMYDSQDFIGHFSNFTLDQDDEHPYIFNYNFEFVISALSGSESQIRGHYRKLAVSPEDPENANSGTAGARELQLISDVYSEEAAIENIVPPKPVDDRTTQRLWEQKTGLPWSEAMRYRQTDGTVQGNLDLRKNLYSKTWDPNKHAFV